MKDLDKYKDISGDGGIKGFVSMKEGLLILFDNGFMYLYDHVKPGKTHVAKMKQLAKQGQGLKTYINQNVRGNYRKKFPAEQILS